jgi:hypothetical protein
MARKRHHRTDRRRWPLSAVIGLLLLAGLALWQVGGSLATMGWRQAQGEIVESEIRQFRADDTLLYRFHLRYRYRVDDSAYIGRRASAGGLLDTTRLEPDDAAGSGLLSHLQRRFPLPRIGDPAVLLDQAARYPAGQPVAVHYDPRQPQRAVLEPGVKLRVLGLLLGLAVVVVLFGVAGMLLRRAWSSLRSPGPRRSGWRSQFGYLLVALTGVALIAASYGGEQAALAEPLPLLSPDTLCGGDDDGGSPWSRLDFVVPTAPRWYPTGLAKPAFAECASDQLTRLDAATLSHTRLNALLGCRIALEATPETAVMLDFGSDTPPDAVALPRYQQAHRFDGVDIALWLLSARHDGSPVPGRRRWQGRLVRSSDFALNRGLLAGRGFELLGELQRLPFVLLSDQAAPVPQWSPSLHPVDECALLSVPAELADRIGQQDARWTLRRRSNRHGWPEPGVAAQRPLLLEAVSEREWREQQGFWWRGLRQAGIVLALIGLVPAVLLLSRPRAG